MSKSYKAYKIVRLQGYNSNVKYLEKNYKFFWNDSEYLNEKIDSYLKKYPDVEVEDFEHVDLNDQLLVSMLCAKYNMLKDFICDPKLVNIQSQESIIKLMKKIKSLIKFYQKEITKSKNK